MVCRLRDVGGDIDGDKVTICEVGTGLRLMLWSMDHNS